MIGDLNWIESHKCYNDLLMS